MCANFNIKTQKPFRQELRNNPTRSEELLWMQLKGKQLSGFKFRRQHGVGVYVVDFYCPELKLAIEIDGPQHFTESGVEYDLRRQKLIESFGIKFLRFTDDEVRESVDTVVKKIEDEIKKMI